LFLRQPLAPLALGYEWVTQTLRQTDAKIFTEVLTDGTLKTKDLAKLNRKANEAAQVMTRWRSPNGVLIRFLVYRAGWRNGPEK
jgi:hypothetical protein